MKEQIEKAAAVLIGKNLWDCNRAVDLASFAFGEKRQVSSDDKVKVIGEYGLHVQCAWQIAREDQVLVGSADVYYPAGDEEFSENFDWDKGPNRRDKLLYELFEGGKHGYAVTGIEGGAAGKLRIRLSEGLTLEIMPDDSLPHEHWRLFQPYQGAPHFVVTGKGIEEA